MILDAACVMAFLLDEPGAETVGTLLTQNCSISVVNRAEVLDKMIRRGGDQDALDAILDPLDIEVVALDRDVADRAAVLRAKHYHRTKRPVSLADCVALALAKHRQVPLATSDSHLATVTRLEGVSFQGVANSRGLTPTGLE